MATIGPIALDLVVPRWADHVPSPPHDAVNRQERKLHLERFPLSFLGVNRSPEDLDEPLSADDVLAMGRAHLNRLQAAGVFESAPPGYYRYRLDHDQGFQTGLVCGVAVDDYDDGVVRVHERVRTERADLLVDHVRVVGVQSSPIALGWRAGAGAQSVLEADDCGQPVLDITAADGLRQRIWPLTDADQVAILEAELGGSTLLYLIDGHHRAAAASRYRRRHPDLVGPADNWMLSAVFPLNRLTNKAFHRVVHDVGDPGEFRSRLGDLFPTRTVSDPAAVVGRSATEVALRLANDDSWLLIALPLIDAADDGAAVVANLDPVRLATNILGPVLAIDESRPEGRLTYRPGYDDVDTVSSLSTDPGEGLFLMRPVTMDQLALSSDLGLVMPPKSTYFEPKVRSGIFVHRKGR